MPESGKCCLHVFGSLTKEIVNNVQMAKTFHLGLKDPLQYTIGMYVTVSRSSKGKATI